MEFYSFCQQFDDWGALKRREEITRENTFEQKKKKPGLKFNPGFALIEQT